MGLGSNKKASLEAVKVSFIFEGRVSSYFSLNTLWKPLSSLAAGEYPVGLDEDMGPEGTDSGP